jgi:predicted nucleic acid-binding protein
VFLLDTNHVSRLLNGDSDIDLVVHPTGDAAADNDLRIAAVAVSRNLIVVSSARF